LNQGFRPGVVVRHVARALETLLLLDAMQRWITELQALFPPVPNPLWAPKIHDTEHWNPPPRGQGVGLSEAPRGSLGHWIRIDQGKIAHYACVAPTTWNASPKDLRGIRGPIEEALINCPVPEPDNPIGISRLIRSFDPCIACAVHCYTPDGETRQFIIT
jgi:Ni,Fe-hydrogenase I large subunit